LLFAQDIGATPTTIVGAFIFVCLSMVGLVGWIVKRLIDDAAKTQEVFAKALQTVIDHCDKEVKAERTASESRDQGAAERHRESQELLTKIHESSREGVHATRNLMNVIHLRTRLADALQSTELPAWTKSLDGVLLSWNGAAEKTLGWRQGEIVGKSVYDTVVPPERKAEEVSVLRRIAEGNSVDEYQTDRLHKDGRRVRLMVVTSPILDREGRVTGASTLAHEV
jgi:PAS domain S-box-containing protein